MKREGSSTRTDVEPMKIRHDVFVKIRLLFDPVPPKLIIVGYHVDCYLRTMPDRGVREWEPRWPPFPGLFRGIEVYLDKTLPDMAISSKENLPQHVALRYGISINHFIEAQDLRLVDAAAWKEKRAGCNV